MCRLGRRRRAAFAVSLLAAGTLVLAADPPDSPRLSSLYETASSSVILVEFWARDPDGHPVTGLRPDEVRLYVDGGLRPIETLEPALEPAVRSPGAAPPLAVPGVAATGSRRFVLFFNDGMSQPEGMSRARRAALDFIAQGGAPGDLFAIVSSEEARHFRLVQDFSADRAQVAESLRRNLDDGTRPSSLFLEIARPKMDGANGTIGFGTVVDPIRARQALIERKVVGQQIRIVGRGTVDALKTVIAWLAPFRGPKAILLMADGLSGAQREDLSDVSRAASAASVTIHAANTAGFKRFSYGDNVLATLAVATGGLRVNSNDPSALFRGVEDEAAGAYVLSFVPEGKADGRPHSLRLACTRPGVQLRHRHIFIRETPEQTRKRVVEAAFAAPEIHADFALDAMLPLRGEARDLVLYVPADRLLFVPGWTHLTAQVEVGAVVRDERDKVVARVSRRLEIRLPNGSAPGRPAIDLRLSGALPPEGRSVTAVILDLESGAVGATQMETDRESRAAMLAGLTLGEPGERSLWISTDASGSKAAPGPGLHALGGARRMRFATTESPVCEIRLAEGRPSGGHGLRIVLEEGASSTLLMPLDGAEVVATGRGTLIRTRLPLRDVPPGEFVLKLEEAGDGGPHELGRLPLRVVAAGPSSPDSRL